MLPAVLVLAFGGLLLLGVAMDVSRWASNHREAATAADAGAQAGAAMVSVAGLRAGQVTLDIAEAEATAVDVAQQSRPRLGRVVVATVEGSRVCVAVTQPFRSQLLDWLSVTPQAVRVSSCAAPARG